MKEPSRLSRHFFLAACSYSCCVVGPLCGVLWDWSCHQPVGHCQPGLLLTAHVMPLSCQQLPSPSLHLVRAQDVSKSRVTILPQKGNFKMKASME